MELDLKGNNTSCLDLCGVPNGDNSSCVDCSGIPNGLATTDNCGVCDVNEYNDCVQDCTGEWGGDNDYAAYYYNSDLDSYGTFLNRIELC